MMKSISKVWGVLSVLSLFGSSLMFACSDDPGTLQPDDKDARENTPLESKETPPSNSNNNNNSNSSSGNVPKSGTTADAGTATPTQPKTCLAETTQTSCLKCCGASATGGGDNPLNSCGCGAGSKCAADCAANLCADKLPDFKCGLCLAQAGCDLNGGGGGADDPGGAVKACVEQSGCANKPQQ